MHLRALELVGVVKSEASMESGKASFGGPDWQELAGVPKCFTGVISGDVCKTPRAISAAAGSMPEVSTEKRKRRGMPESRHLSNPVSTREVLRGNGLGRCTLKLGSSRQLNIFQKITVSKGPLDLDQRREIE